MQKNTIKYKISQYFTKAFNDILKRLEVVHKIGGKYGKTIQVQLGWKVEIRRDSFFSNLVARTQNSKLNEKMKVIEHIPGYSSWKTVHENEVAKYVISFYKLIQGGYKVQPKFERCTLFFGKFTVVPFKYPLSEKFSQPCTL